MDDCFGDRRSFILVQDKGTGDRFKVDMVNKTVAVAAASPSAPIAKILRRIESSLSGIRALPTEFANARPLPTSPACDPSVAVPTLAGN